MADIRISCPHCALEMTADELWAGHELQCPGCQKTFQVAAPEAPAAAARNPLVPKPPSGNRSRLALGQTPGPASTENRNIPIRNLAGPAPKKSNKLVPILQIVGVVLLVGAGGYFGYGFLRDYQNKSNAKRDAEAAKNSGESQVGHIASLNNVLNATEPGGPGLGSLSQNSGAGGRTRASAPPAERAGGGAADAAASTPGAATWTLDLSSVTLPNSPASGSIAGTKFTPESARVDPVGTLLALRLLDGAPTSPEREMMIYLRLKAGERLGGQKLTVSSDDKSGVPQVIKRWKQDPRYAPTLKAFANGYALKLELGDPADGVIPGKIYLALPDAEKSFLAGSFKATITPATTPTYQPAAAAPVARPTSPNSSMTPEMQKRYGVGGRR